MTQLEQYLAIHIRWLKETVSSVPPHSDLPPLLTYSGPTERLAFLPVPPNNNTREWAQGVLQEGKATHYATVTAAYAAMLDGLERDKANRLAELMRIHGTRHPEILPYRQECYVVSAGDRDGTLVAVFIVARDQEGRIAKLTRQSDLTDSAWAGSMVDLLAESRH